MKYIRNLHNIDDKVLSVSPQAGKDNRIFIGIVIVCGSHKYCIPLSSPKGKHKNMKNSMDFSKIEVNGKLLGVLNFNLMIPIEEKQLQLVDTTIFKRDRENIRYYKKLCTLELEWCQTNNEVILYTFSVKLTRDVQIEENQDIQFKIFSDNIIIAKKLSNQIPQRTQEIRSLLMCAGHFQELSASDSVGWLLRGGISIGQLFIDDVMVWGEALLKSYFLEDKVANYPRIIIDKDIVNEIIQNNVLCEYLRKDFDDLYFLNFLNDCHFCGEMLMNGFQIMQKEAGIKIEFWRCFLKVN